MTKIQIIREDGRPAFAVVPWQEFKERIEPLMSDEELADLAMEETVGEETFPDDVVRRMMEGESPVRVLRDYRGLSQSTLAGRVGTSALYISQIERGARNASLKMLRKIAAALEVTLDDLV